MWRGAADLGFPMMRQSQKSQVSKQEVLTQTVPKVSHSWNQLAQRTLLDSSVGLEQLRFLIPCGLNRIHPSLTAVPSLCPLCVLSVTLSLEQGLSFRTCLHSSCSSYSRMTPCEHSFHSHGISSWFIPYLKWSSLSVSVCLTKLSQTWGSAQGF